MLKKIIFYFYHRKLRFDILTLFLVLLLASSLVIITFSYYKSRSAIIERSKETIVRVSSLINERIVRLVEDFQQLSTVAEIFLANFSTLSLENKPLILFIHASVKAYPKVQAFYIANPQGDFIEVIDVSVAKERLGLESTNPSLPKNVAYVLRVIDRSNQSSPQEVWYYKDENFQAIGQEISNPVTYDPRERPWYLGTQKSKGLYWSDVYSFESTEEPGVSVSVPFFDDDGKLVAVIGADLPLNILSDFLAEQKIGKTGKAYILDRSGKVLMPLGAAQATPINEAFLKFTKTHMQSFLFKAHGEDWLAYVEPLPAQFQKNWVIAIVAPFNDFFGKIIKAQREVVLVALLILTLAGILVVYFSKRISTPIVSLANEIDQIKHLNLDSEMRIKSNIREINLLDDSIASMRIMLRSFGKYVPKKIVEQLMQRDQEIALGGEKTEVTVLFSDIADFTTLTERYPTEFLMPLMGAYFDMLSRIILETQGTIDKYIGDSIMAFWGAPQAISQHERWACMAALRCQKALVDFNKSLENEGKPTLKTRIGIHTGTVIVGNIGTTERMNYTIMGDVVNAASRLQHINKDYHTFLMISDEVHQKIGDEFLVRPLDIVAVKGKTKKIKIYELVALSQEASNLQIELCGMFSRAFLAFSQGAYQEARALFLKISLQFPDDFPTKLYLDRLNNLI